MKFHLFIAGLSQEEFSRFMSRVPTHLKEKFEKIAADFQKYDKNQDNVIDYQELSGMLDAVMKEEN